MPTYDAANRQITLTDNKSHLRRYTKGKPAEWRRHRDAIIVVPLGRIEWKSVNLQDGMQAEKLPKTMIVAEDNGGFESDWLHFEWVLEESVS
jgi:hypothetical protein